MPDIIANGFEMIRNILEASTEALNESGDTTIAKSVAFASIALNALESEVKETFEDKRWRKPLRSALSP